jgi:predicted glycosyltransferase involved in capsule biosynthesis
LPKNAEWLEAAQAELIIVNGAGDTSRLRDLIKTCSYGGIRVLDIEGTQYFNKPECLNIGAFFSRSDWVFTLDTDIILTPDFLESALHGIAGNHRFATVKEVVELGPEIRMLPSDPQGAVVQRVITTTVVHENGHTATIEYSADKHGTRSGVGLVLARREHFIGIQGLNSNLRGWGYEDFDFQIRLQLGLGLERVSLGRAQHVSHSPAQSAAVSHSRNIAIAWRNYSKGKLDGTFDSDIARLKDKVVELVP